MAVREFDGDDDVLTMAVGDLANATGGTLSIAVVWKPGTDSHFGGIVQGRNAGDAITFSMHTFDADVWIDIGGDSSFACIPYAEADGWVIHGLRNQAGENGVRSHVYNLTTPAGWAHANIVEGRTAADTTPATLIRIGAFGTNNLDGRLAAIAVWDGTALDDTQFETLSGGLAAWLALNPTACWVFNQAAVTDDVLDLTGGGADQTARTGTTVITDDDPPAFPLEVASGGHGRVFAPGVPIRSGG
jgi:hypothetical protein